MKKNNPHRRSMDYDLNKLKPTNTYDAFHLLQIESKMFIYSKLSRL